MASPHAGNHFVLIYLNARRTKPAREFVEIAASQSWVRLLRRTKIVLDTQVNLHSSALKPASSALRQLGRLRNFPHPQQIAIKPPRGLFLASRHSQLHMINRDKWPLAHAKCEKDFFTYYG